MRWELWTDIVFFLFVFCLIHRYDECNQILNGHSLTHDCKIDLSLFSCQHHSLHSRNYLNHPVKENFSYFWQKRRQLMKTLNFEWIMDLHEQHLGICSQSLSWSLHDNWQINKWMSCMLLCGFFKEDVFLPDMRWSNFSEWWINVVKYIWGYDLKVFFQ